MSQVEVTTIVVGVDGSEDGQLAAAWAAQFAARLSATVVAVHAIGLLEHERGDPGNVHIQAQLARWIQPLDELPAGRVRPQVIPGTPVSAILYAVEAERADIVVVGTRGHGARNGVLLGSTSLQLAEKCPCPLVIVPRPAS